MQTDAENSRMAKDFLAGNETKFAEAGKPIVRVTGSAQGQ
jgi:hypothetical protein